MPRAEWKTIAEAYFAVPQAEEQEKIGILFHKLEQLIAAEKRKLNLLQKKKTTLLRQIFEQKLRFKGYSDFWEQHKLGSLGISYSGLSGKTKTDFGHGLASYITYMNVFQNPIADIDSNGQIEIDAKQHTVRYGDALFTISSETPEEVGMSSVWIGNQKNVYLNSFCFGYRQDGAFDVLYLAYMLRSEAVRNQMRMLAQGISRFNISQHKVMDINVNIPSISEQQKIGSFCRGLDQLISAEVKKDRFTDAQEESFAATNVRLNPYVPFCHAKGAWQKGTYVPKTTPDPLFRRMGQHLQTRGCNRYNVEQVFDDFAPS